MASNSLRELFLDFAKEIASDLGTEFITLDNFQPDPNVQNMMPATLVRLHGALPVRHGPEGLYVCLVDPLNPQTVEDLRFALGQDIHVLVAPDYQISERINELYGGESAAMSDLMQELNNMQVNNETEDSAAAPVIRFVDLVITQAIKEKVSHAGSPGFAAFQTAKSIGSSLASPTLIRAPALSSSIG